MPLSSARNRRIFGAALGIGVLAGSVGILAAQQPVLPPDKLERFQRQSREAEVKGLAEPFTGVTANGTVESDLFAIRSTGVSTEPVRQAALAFRASLTPQQRAESSFAVDDDEWRSWMNQHFYIRRGVSFGEMSPAQRQAATGLLQASLSAKGLRQTRDIMRLNTTLGELTNNPAEYGEGLYHFTMMGEPSATKPWGWQLDGHMGPGSPDSRKRKSKSPIDRPEAVSKPQGGRTGYGWWIRSMGAHTFVVGRINSEEEVVLG